MIKFFMVLGLLLTSGCAPNQHMSQLPEQFPGHVPVHPLTDKVHVDVYTFVGQYLKSQRSLSPLKDVKNWLENEKKHQNDPSFKPHTAGIQEGEMAGLLRVLLKKDPRYENITLYGKDGVGLATSGMRHGLIFGEERPNPLRFGLLTPDILKGPLHHRYTKNGESYEETLLTIYKTDNGTYVTSESPKNQKNTLIGYLSYINGKSLSLPENQDHGR